MSIYGNLINESLSDIIQSKFDNKIKEQNSYYKELVKELKSDWDLRKYKKSISKIKKDISTFRNMSQTKGTSSQLQNKLKTHLKFLEKQKNELDFIAFQNGVI